MHRRSPHNEAQEDGCNKGVCEAGDADHPALKAAEAGPSPVKEVVER